jgi:hypothetical protein
MQRSVTQPGTAGEHGAHSIGISGVPAPNACFAGHGTTVANSSGMAHQQTTQAAFLSLIEGAETRWPGVAAAATTWWGDASETLSASDTFPTSSSIASRCGRPIDEAQAPAWPDVATVAGAWWDDEAEVVVRTQQTPVAVDEEPEAHWPGLAASATAWWNEELPSGIYATHGFEPAELATA